jgi:hypothetical protein
MPVVLLLRLLRLLLRHLLQQRVVLCSGRALLECSWRTVLITCGP